MMAGHPNDASWLGLRNVAFAIQAGGRDAAYNRNKVAQEWIDRLDKLHKDDPGGTSTLGQSLRTRPTGWTARTPKCFPGWRPSSESDSGSRRMEAEQ